MTAMAALRSLCTELSLLVLLGTIAWERARVFARWCRPRMAMAIAPALAAAACVLALRAGGWSNAVLIACAAICSLSDLLTGYIFDRVLIVAAALLVPAIVACGHAPQALGGALVAGAPMLLPWIATRGRGMGLGDAKLASFLGAGLGMASAATALACAAIGGGIFAALLLTLRRATRDSALPFGPFLAFGAYLALACKA